MQTYSDQISWNNPHFTECYVNHTLRVPEGTNSFLVPKSLGNQNDLRRQIEALTTSDVIRQAFLSIKRDPAFLLAYIFGLAKPVLGYCGRRISPNYEYLSDFSLFLLPSVKVN